MQSREQSTNGILETLVSQLDMTESMSDEAKICTSTIET